MRILDTLPVKQVYHWVDGRSIMCTGTGCIYCRQGKKPKIRYTYNVEIDGQVYKWEFGTKILRQLMSYAEEPKERQGALITVRRLGTGLQTQYVITSFRRAGNVTTSSNSKHASTSAEDVRHRTQSEAISEFVEDALKILNDLEGTLLAIKRILEGEVSNES